MASIANMFAVSGASIFDGEAFLESSAVLIENTRIVDVIKHHKVSPKIAHIKLQGGILAPGFIDVQVNGGGGALMNDNPTIDTVQHIAAAHRKFGTTAMLPTVITDAPHILRAAIAAIKAARAAKVPGILGIHIEGPFLDRDRKGAHDARYIRDMMASDVELVLNADCGIVMLTVAPNRVSPEHIRALSSRGILVSLGHSNATLAEANVALGAGAVAFTHLFNAMSQMNGREPGMVGAALLDAESFCGLIADGFHVHDAAMKVAMAAKKPNLLMLITDAMPTAAGGPDRFDLQGRTVRLERGRLILDDGTLAGSNLTMDAALRYCVVHLGVKIEDALRMTSLNPATFMKLDREMGRIRPGYCASLVHLSDDLTVLQTWINGK